MHWLIFLLLLALPFLVWGNSVYQAGGDDSRLYYLMPGEILNKYVFNLYSRNTTGALGVYGSQAYQVPFLTLIVIFKKLLPFVNTQNLFYGLNLAFGYLGFILLYRELSAIKLKTELEAISGLFYVFSNFTAYTLWSHQLFPLYLVSVFPFAVYLFMRALKTNFVSYSIFLVILLSLFSITLIAIPWTLGVVGCFLPVIIYLAIKYKQVFLKHFSILIFLLILLNSYWFFHFLFPALSSFGSGEDIISRSITSESSGQAGSIMRIVSKGNSILLPLFSQFHSLVQPVSRLLPLFVFFPLIIFAKFIFARPKESLHFYLFAFWITSIYLFTVNIFGESGLGFFLWLNGHIPGFNMFRFMYDKFGYALALSSSLLLISSIDVMQKITSRKIYLFLTLFITLILIFGAKRLQDTSQSLFSITDLNQDYYDLTSHLKNSSDETKIVWWPLNVANYIPISDRMLEGHYYFGISPLVYLSNKSELAGLPGFGPYAGELTAAIDRGDGEQILKVFNKVNINYIILNNDYSPQFTESDFYPGGLYQSQMRPKILKKLLGRKIKDFGEDYSLYEINPQYSSKRISLAGVEDKQEKLLITKEISQYKYMLTFEVLSQSQMLNFLESKSNQWQILSTSGEMIKLDKISDGEYGNRWVIDSSLCSRVECVIKDGRNIATIYLYFRPELYDRIVKIISLLALSGCILYLFMRIIFHTINE